MQDLHRKGLVVRKGRIVFFFSTFAIFCVRGQRLLRHKPTPFHSSFRAIRSRGTSASPSGAENARILSPRIQMTDVLMKDPALGAALLELGLGLSDTEYDHFQTVLGTKVVAFDLKSHAYSEGPTTRYQHKIGRAIKK
jgi:hypothetical protein